MGYALGLDIICVRNEMLGAMAVEWMKEAGTDVKVMKRRYYSGGGGGVYTKQIESGRHMP